MSEETELIGLCMCFTEGGDSGSIVLNQYGELVGLLFTKKTFVQATTALSISHL